MKSYTDIEQSRKLAEILPLESADFHFSANLSPEGYLEKPIWGNPECVNYSALPCWSLAALLGILPKYELNNFGDTIQLDVNLEALATEGDETLLDLVVNMIIKLSELKML